MKLKRIGNNQTVIVFDDGTSVLWSYETPVAAYIPGEGLIRTSKFHSQTTSGHIDAWLGGESATLVPQEELDSLVEVTG